MPHTLCPITCRERRWRLILTTSIKAAQIWNNYKLKQVYSSKLSFQRHTWSCSSNVRMECWGNIPSTDTNFHIKTIPELWKYNNCILITYFILIVIISLKILGLSKEEFSYLDHLSLRFYGSPCLVGWSLEDSCFWQGLKSCMYRSFTFQTSYFSRPEFHSNSTNLKHDNGNRLVSDLAVW